MTMHKRAWMLAAAIAGLTGPALAQPGPAPATPPRSSSGANLPIPAVATPSVRAGVEAWQAGNFSLAIGNWRPLADRGDADAQYNIAQAYFLGRGVPQNNNLAEQWYERAARQGHEEAQGNLGLILFQNGRRREAMPWIEQAAGRGDARAQYVLGTALFNGDLVAQDSARAYALMTRAAAQGLPPAVTQLATMEQHISEEDRARGTQLARELASARPAQLASAAPERVPVSDHNRQAPPRGQSAPPPRQQAAAAPAPRISPPVRPVTQAAARPPAAAPAPASGRWRIQLGAYSSEANARRAWSAVSGRLGGSQPYYVRAGAVFRLQAGPFASRAAAVGACGRTGQSCFPVAP
jgi:TPR repeat protein